MQKVENIKTVVCSYDEGIIPKENISFNRYLLLPVDPDVKDLSLASRALNHIIATKQKIDQLLTQLQKRKTELFNSQMELKKWAANEHAVISRFILTINELCVKVTALENDVSHTVKGLTKRFGSKSLDEFERKRQKQRQKEQKSKNKRKKKMVYVRQARSLLRKSKFVEDDINEICPDSYLKRASKTIKMSDLTKESFPRKKKSIMYLQSIGAFDNLVEVTSSDEESEYMDSDSDMSLDD